MRTRIARDPPLDRVRLQKDAKARATARARLRLDDPTHPMLDLALPASSSVGYEKLTTAPIDTGERSRHDTA